MYIPLFGSRLLPEVTMESISKHVITQFKSGDKNAFKHIYVYYSPRVFSLSKQLLKDNELAEEMVQECFMKLWINRLKIKEDLDIWPYLFVMCKRLCLNVLRDIKMARTSIDFFQENAVNDVEHTVYHNELQHELKRYVAMLPSQQRTAWILSREEGFTHQEIASQMEISQNTVKNHIVQAVKFLKKRLASRELISLLLFLFFL